MASTPAVVSHLIWVTHGKAQHPAFLLESKESESRIRWASNNKEEWVQNDALEMNITPRRRKRPETFIDSFQPLKSVTISPKRSFKVKNEDSDDEIEVLLTVQPFTPKRQKLPPASIPQSTTDSTQTQCLKRKSLRSTENRNLENGDGCTLNCEGFSDDDTTDDDEALTLEEFAAKSALQKISIYEHVISDSNDSYFESLEIKGSTHLSAPDQINLVSGSVGTLPSGYVSAPDGASSSIQTPFSARSSAYVQNLAEICFTIMNDQRWTTGGINRHQLFSWENGEDLKAVKILCQIYDQAPKGNVQCSCLLCREKKEINVQIIDTSTESKKVKNQHYVIEAEDERVINLFCRLYYRKGPWFRLDDIYTRYYEPKRFKPELASVEPPEHSAHHCPVELERRDNDSKFPERHFAERAFRNKNDIDNTNPQKRIYFDATQLEENVCAMKALLADIERLKRLGLIRSFNDEEECGRTVGSNRNEGHGTLFNADERYNILQKLGGTKKKPTGLKGNDATGRRTTLYYGENEIWKQMCQQQSIVSLVTNSNGSKYRALLPVCHHVNHEVFSKLALSIVLGASLVEYLPSTILKAKVKEVKSLLHMITSEILGSSSLQTCFCLQEAPSNTLRRCCRLFLCATSGPGDMRGDGTNGWKSLAQSHRSDGIPFTYILNPPGINTWHNVTYPGLSHRFKLAHHGFTAAHTGIEFCIDSHLPFIQVFQNINAFRMWELSVELRSFFDYQLELNEIILNQERGKQREDPQRRDESGEDKIQIDGATSTDFLKLLDPGGREKLIRRLLIFTSTIEPLNCEELTQILYEKVEHTLSIFEESSQPNSTEEAASTTLNASALVTECEKVVFVGAIILTFVLELRHVTISKEERTTMTIRPWLRHLWWEGVLSYVLWDCIPILEKRGFYGIASKALEVLVFGSTQTRRWKSPASHEPAFDSGHREWGTSETELDEVPLCEYLISRRARGKAHERLMIDYVHLLRSEGKASQTYNASNELKAIERCELKQNKNRTTMGRATETVIPLCSLLLSRAAKSASIPFAAIRSLAKRLKQPLASLIHMPTCIEASIFGFRLGDRSKEFVAKKNGYMDWCPIVDEAVAIALTGNEQSTGQRCSYVGFEDDEHKEKVPFSSLNVEQLATEFYSSGRLPKNDPVLSGGGWVGWHDEGRLLRTLFRIICAGPILGMDSGCGSHCYQSREVLERSTVHLTPYQSAPFDLHVGSWSNHRLTHENDHKFIVPGFFARRRDKIERYLGRIAQLDSQEISDLVFDCVNSRLDSPDYHQRLVTDFVLVSDLKQLRTLSMLAAGFGGAHLAAVFRCMLFDYRHYSGGLPDLLLVRAFYIGKDSTKVEGVNLGEWVGEAFSPEAQAQKENLSRAAILIDKDDEFLGCSKMGDSTTRNANRWGRSKLTEKKFDTDIQLPESLKLVHNERAVKIQCMFVEVKSSNDRLDGRQEDWLNLLDRIGHARVCKFVDNKKRFQNKAKDLAAKSVRTKKTKVLQPT